MSRVTFYDPLYDFVTFEEAERQRPREIFDAGFAGAVIGGASKSLKPFIAAPEFSRLAFLRQSDLGFLVYPSATHTRFAHAIGCCYLGYVAAREIVVGVRNGYGAGETREVVLAKWLEEKGWKEEFLLALLLHDVGHFAFSHALENNIEFWTALGKRFNHEQIAIEIVRGEGRFVAEMWRRWGRSDECPSVADLLARLPQIDSAITAFLISGDESQIQHKDPPTRNALWMLHELTSGLLDLDRVDHYRRDSYFSGMKFASNLNFSSLLSGFSIWYSPDEPAGRHEIRLTREAIGHALTLLHAKERLVHDCFENVENLAYEVMLHQAFNFFCCGDHFYETPHVEPDWVEVESLACELLMMTDEQLLHELERGTEKTERIVRRIRNRQPYAFVARRAWERRNPVAVEELRREIVKSSGVKEDDVLIRLGKGYGLPRELRPTEWLHLDSLSDEEGFPLEEHAEFRRQIEHFKQVQDDNLNVFWVFTPLRGEQATGRIREGLDRVIGRRG